MKWIVRKTPSLQPSPQGERELSVRVPCHRGSKDISGVLSPLGERDRVRGDFSRAAVPRSLERC